MMGKWRLRYLFELKPFISKQRVNIGKICFTFSAPVIPLGIVGSSVYYGFHSTASHIPLLPTAKVASLHKQSKSIEWNKCVFHFEQECTAKVPVVHLPSASGSVGESNTVQIRFSPLPFLNRNLVVDA